MRLPLAICLLWAATAQGQTVCLGDSVTRSTPFVQFGEGYCERLGGINAGVGGQTAIQGLARFRSDVLSRRPKRVIIEFGLNDAALGIPVGDYRRALRRMIRMFRGKVVLMTPNPYGNDYVQNRRLLPYVMAVRSLARREHVRLVDNFAAFGEVGLLDYLPAYYADELHPNAAGHEVIFSNLP